MTNLLDNICQIRDLLVSGNYGRLKMYKMKFCRLKDEIHRQTRNKALDFKHELDFTSQDLRELAEDIRNLLKHWADVMNPETNIKALAEATKDGKIMLEEFPPKVIPIMQARTETIQPLIELLNIVEYHAVYLYYIEEASNDRVALNFTERII